MASIKLGNRPKNFKRIVKFGLIEGGEGSIECTFKYRTRSEFGRLIDGMAHDARQNGAAGADLSVAQIMDATKDKNAAYLLDVLDGWNLDEVLTRDTAAQLCDELPGAATEIMEAYRLAIVEGRLGN
ncbi:MAG: hypothetical protein E6Q92_03065 [Burkholderiaceae bacterium]|jgi:hypothetical protein|nr:MAG: hypothetical protein E6Q92_03065 [Burkholderiaceae bacterium]